MTASPVPEWCKGSLSRVVNESSAGPGWGACPVCDNGFYVVTYGEMVTIPLHVRRPKGRGKRP